MEKSKLNVLTRQAHQAGNIDSYLEQRVIESAQLWIDEQGEDLSDDDCDQLVEAYRRGFFEKPLSDEETAHAVKSILAVLDLSDCELGASQQEHVEDAVRSAIEQALN